MQKAWLEADKLIDKLDEEWAASHKKYEEFEAQRAKAAGVLDEIARIMVRAANEQYPDAQIRISPLVTKEGKMEGLKVFINDVSHTFTREETDAKNSTKP